MKRLFTYTLLIFMLSLASCKKGSLDYQIQGTISDASFNFVPLSGSSVELFAYQAGSTQRTLIEQQVTSSSGEYAFTTPRERIIKYELIVRKQHYFTSIATINLSDLTTENVNTYNIDMNAVSWVKISLKNSLTPSPSDELKLLKQNFYTDCNDCCPNGFSFYYGIMDTVITCPTLPNDYIVVHHWLNGNQKYGYDSLITVPLDTTYINIVY